MDTNEFKAEQVLEMMLKLFGERMADPEVHPKQFEYQVKLAKFELNLKGKNNDSTGN